MLSPAMYLHSASDTRSPARLRAEPLELRGGAAHGTQHIDRFYQLGGGSMDDRVVNLDITQWQIQG